MFKEYEEFAEPMRLPINGKTYTIPPVGMRDGVELVQKVEARTPIGDESLGRLLLGAAYDEMFADNVPQTVLVRAVMTALSEFQHGRATAELMWETGGDPKAVQALLTREDAGSTTPRPASGNGTRKKQPTRRSTSSSNSGRS